VPEMTCTEEAAFQQRAQLVIDHVRGSHAGPGIRHEVLVAHWQRLRLFTWRNSLKAESV
jgi:hypothetical protein